MTTKKTKITPYWHWWHPEKTIIDIIVSFILSLLLRVPKTFPNDAQTAYEKVAPIAKSRTSLKWILEMQLNSNESFYRIWSKLIDQDIVEVSLELPRRDDELLAQWGIQPQERQHLHLPSKGTVLVHVAFPIAILPDSVKAPTKLLASGALAMEQTVGLDCIQKILETTASLPVLIFAHGGGYTMGTPRASELVTELLKHHSTKGEKPKPFLYASIRYSLAPEHPFPAAPLEATSVCAWFLERARPKSVHMTGISAGAGLMLSAYAGILKSSSVTQRPASVIAVCPMLSPTCDAQSFLENETSSLSAPAQWLRWSYRCYLQMPMKSIDDDGCTMMSNRSAWQQSIWYSSALRDIAEPDDYIRKHTDPESVKIVLTTNSADPLRDGGFSFAESVKNVEHLRHRGSHFVGTVVDQRHLGEFREMLCKVILGNH